MEDTNPQRPIVIGIIGSGSVGASVTRQLYTFYKHQYQFDDRTITDVVIEDEASAGLPFIDIPVHVDPLALERFTELAKSIEPVVITFQHLASTAEEIAAALRGWSIDNVVDISRQLRASKIDFELVKVQQATEYNHKLPDVAVPTRKKKKRGHNSALDRVICKSAYC